MFHKIKSLDVRLKDLLNLSEVKSLHPIFEFLNEYWYVLDGKLDKERYNSVRIGYVDIGFDEENHLVIEFTTRFTLDKYVKLIESMYSK